MKIFVFGSANLDSVYRVPRIVLPGETLASSSCEIFAGGKGLNQAIASAKAGAEVLFLGAVGKDGDLLIQMLKNAGVRTEFVKDSALPTGCAVIQVADSGENSIILFHGANYDIDESYIDQALFAAKEGDLLILQNEINRLERIIEKAYQKGMRILLNPSPFEEKLRKLDYRKISYLILNEVEANGLTGAANPEKLREWVGKVNPDLKVILTLGKKGSVYLDGEKEIHQGIFKVKAVDTTAAGDTFTGFFAAGLTRGLAIEECLKISALASAIAVTRKGAGPSIPTMDEVKKELPLRTEE